MQQTMTMDAKDQPSFTEVDPIKHSTTINNDNIDMDKDKDGEQEYKTMQSQKRSFTTSSAPSVKNNNKQWKFKIVEIAVNVEIDIDINAANTVAVQEDKNKDKDKTYDLNQIISLDCLQTSTPLCSGGDAKQCRLSTCLVWVLSKNQKKKWYCCIDYQERDFGGWSPAFKIPYSRLEPEHSEHLSVITQMCSQKKNPAMPTFKQNQKRIITTSSVLE